jgi:molecular chaperone GrpE
MTHKHRDEHEDVDFEPEDEMGSVGALKAKIDKLKHELKETKEKRDEYLDGWQRAKADMANIRKEAAADALRAGARGKEALIEDILPALDAFDMAALSESWSAIDDSWRSGMEQVRNQLLNALSHHGIERFGKVGEKTDHALHEIMQEVDDVAGDPGTIVRILRYGYRAGDRVIRPAHVIAKR